MTITAKFPGKCRKCGGQIKPGDRIEWFKGEGSEHTVCPTPASAPVAAPVKAAPVATAKQTYPPTPEQQAAIDLFSTGDSFAIEAGAGTGKTSTLLMLANSTTRRGQYIAFNKAIVTEGKAKFPSSVSCDTAHALAYRNATEGMKRRLAESRRMRSEEVAAILGIKPINFPKAGVDNKPKTLTPKFLGSLVLASITRFCQSADEAPSDRHVPFVEGLDAPDEYENNDQLAKLLVPFVIKAWEDLMEDEGQLAFKHDHYLKAWQLSGPRIQADYILFDEAQDANPVMVAIVAAQTHAQLVWVGDSQQQIYTFTGAVNALANVPATHRTFLTQSFRFGTAVAEAANVCLDRLEADLRVKGWDKITSTVEPVATPNAILCRTNAAAVRAVMDAQARGEQPHLVGGGEQVVRFAKAAANLMQGWTTEHPDLACFSTWGEVQTYVEEDEQGGELQLLVKLVDQFGVPTILAALERMVREADADVVISTAHKAKGREWDAVQLGSDFPEKADGEELRLLYVAVTRAKLQLDVTAVAAFRGGEDIPGAVFDGPFN